MSSENKKIRVVIGLSGGVDSSVAAHILCEQGYEVIGLFMRNWHDTTGTLEGDCPWYDDQIFAELVAKRLDIPFHYIDLSEQYRKRVVDYMFNEYANGRTPNPDVLCNREIKFDAFLDAAIELGADYVATGHYCRRSVEEVDGKNYYRLLSGLDKNKDQSYFLCQLNQKMLSRALFPIGELQKSEVREIAAAQKLATATRKDSQGICFVGKVDLPTFLQQKLTPKKGNIVEIPDNLEVYADYDLLSTQITDTPSSEFLENLSTPFKYTQKMGKVIGEHRGAHYFTIGQRKGLNIGGHKEPLFIIATDVETNTIYVGESDRHHGLYHSCLHINQHELHWVSQDHSLKVGESMRLQFRIRYRQPLQQGTLYIREKGAYIIFDEPQRGITPGQFASWYDMNGDELIGSGVIQY
ncbi:MAG: tRNA 2-thiouridine(34) synthase MnmA [Rikenellaceae bacterium]